MQTTYRLKAQEISMKFLNSLKTLFAGQEVEITVKSVDTKKGELTKNVSGSLLQMVQDNRKEAPVIAQEVDIRELIDNTHNPEGN